MLWVLKFFHVVGKKLAQGLLIPGSATGTERCFWHAPAKNELLFTFGVFVCFLSGRKLRLKSEKI